MPACFRGLLLRDYLENGLFSYYLVENRQGLTRFPRAFRGRLLGCPEQLVQVANLEKPVVVHWMAVFREFTGAAPVAERVAANAEVTGRFVDPYIFIEFGHQTPLQRV